MSLNEVPSLRASALVVVATSIRCAVLGLARTAGGGAHLLRGLHSVALYRMRARRGQATTRSGPNATGSADGGVRQRRRWRRHQRRRTTLNGAARGARQKSRRFRASSTIGLRGPDEKLITGRVGPPYHGGSTHGQCMVNGGTPGSTAGQHMVYGPESGLPSSLPSSTSFFKGGMRGLPPSLLGWFAQRLRASSHHRASEAYGAESGLPSSLPTSNSFSQEGSRPCQQILLVLFEMVENVKTFCTTGTTRRSSIESAP